VKILRLRHGARAEDLGSVLALFAVTLVTRLPYFSVSVINWDESTFAILGQDLLDGHLPYTHLWDTKPPLVYVVFALFIYLFGRSIVALRIGGLLCVWAAASIVYYGIGRQWDRLAGWTGALVVIVACATLPAGQATMSEHLALVPLSLVLVILLNADFHGARAFGLGVLLGFCVLIRADTAMLAVGVAIIVFVETARQRLSEGVRRTIWLAAGTCVPLLLTIVTYALLGQFAILRTTFLDASFAYVTLDGGTSRRWFLLRQIWTNLASLAAGPVLLVVVGVGLIFATRAEGRRPAAVLMGMSAALFAGLVLAGGGFGHYVLIEAPVVGVAAGLVVHAHRHRRVVVLSLFALVLVASVGGLVRRYVAHASEPRVMGGEDLPRRLARFLESRHVAGQYVFFNTAHVAGWLSRVEHPSKFVHPSNLTRVELLRALDGPTASVEGELRGILSKRPVFLILTADSLEGTGGDAARAIYRRTLREGIGTGYQLEYRDGDVLIFRRADLPPGGQIP
jgi:4-amino-4-deoxy-L-arabinose transferase-like glycosyltransferase